MFKKPEWLKDIKVLVWDLDGTLYDEVTEIEKGIRRNVIKVIAKTRKISLSQAEKLFLKTYKKIHSSTQALLILGVDKKYVLSGEWFNDVQLKNLEKDNRLIEVFKKLRNFKHIISTNSNGPITRKKLKKLGLSLKIFDKIFTNPDMFGVLKPNPLPFKAVLKYSGLKANQHLFLGDHDYKEMIPAKKLAMHTCFVWGKSKYADISLPTVYDVVKLF